MTSTRAAEASQRGTMAVHDADTAAEEAASAEEAVVAAAEAAMLPERGGRRSRSSSGDTTIIEGVKRRNAVSRVASTQP